MQKADTGTIILADGAFPTHDIPLDYLSRAKQIVCCDGSVKNLLTAGYAPFAIVGDMDSLSEEITEKYKDRMFRDDDQETNDLTKSVLWCSKKGFKDLVIVGATGKREDHTIGNISLLADYAKVAKVMMVTDTGILLPFHKSTAIETFGGQQVSIFSFDNRMEISSKGLKYPLVNRKLARWWEATLNEAVGNGIELDFAGGPVIVFLKFMES
jgi:thiamine pyrophosphokinase